MNSRVLPADLDLRIARRLSAGPPPDRSSQERFAPSLCFGRHFGYAPHDVRPAAVIMALYRKGNQWYLPLTRRPTNMKAHAGQICLPGGAIDGGESAETAAVRELEEELGIAAGEVRALGSLPSLNLFVSNFWVTPFVAVLNGEPQFVPNPAEVADVIESPLTTLLDATNHRVQQRRLGPSGPTGWSYDAPYLAVGHERIWGATAVILGGLIEIIQSVDP
jgi:8-oxo-dGTP pyrophosphatase MutT (NUDIX family)